MNGIEQQAMPIQATSLNWNLFYNTSSTKLFFVNYNFFQTDVKKATEVCPERKNTRRTVSNLESEINQIVKRIKTEEKRYHLVYTLQY